VEGRQEARDEKKDVAALVEIGVETGGGEFEEEASDDCEEGRERSERGKGC